MGIFKDKENYLKALAIADAEVQHTAEVDGVVRNSFFRLNDEDELTAATINNIAYPAVGIIGFNGRIIDTDNALVNIRHAITNNWIFLQHVNSVTGEDGEGYTEEIQSAYDQTFIIMERFIKAMKTEYETNGSCGAMADFDLNKISYRPTGKVFQNEYGWIMTFDDEQKAPNII